MDKPWRPASTSYLWYRLSNADHPEVCQAGADLKILRSDRNRADYDLRRPMPQATAAAQVQAGREILRLLDQARQAPIKDQITEAIRIYEREVLRQVTWQP